MAHITAEPFLAYRRFRKDPAADALDAAVFTPEMNTRDPLPETAALDFEIVSDVNGFEALEQEWNALFERAGKSHHVFQTFNWCWHWVNHFLPDQAGEDSGPELRIVIGRRAGRLMMIWPLVLCREGALRSLTWLGDPVSQYGDVLLEPGDCLVEELKEGWAFISKSISADVVRLGKVREDGYVTALLKEIGASVTHEDLAPFLDLSSAASFEDYEKRYTAKARRNRRRVSRRLSEHGALASTLYTHGVNARSFCHEGILLKRQWLESKGLQSRALFDDRVLRFFGDVAEGKGRSVGCRVLRLSLGSATAAMSICFSCKGRVAAHVMAYDLDLQRFGAGTILMENDVRQMFSDNVKLFDLMAPSVRYKTEWADGAIAVRDWAKPRSLLGFFWVHIYLGFLREKLKRLFAAAPVSWRRRATELKSLIGVF